MHLGYNNLWPRAWPQLRPPGGLCRGKPACAGGAVQGRAGMWGGGCAGEDLHAGRGAIRGRACMRSGRAVQGRSCMQGCTGEGLHGGGAVQGIACMQDCTREGLHAGARLCRRGPACRGGLQREGPTCGGGCAGKGLHAGGGCAGGDLHAQQRHSTHPTRAHAPHG